MATDVHRTVGPQQASADSGSGSGSGSDREHGPTTPVPAVRVEGLTRTFDGRAVIDNLQLSIGQDEFVALLGRRGCGKSTLLRVLAGLDSAIEGTVLVPRRKAVAYQAPPLTPWRKVWRTVLLGLGRPGGFRRAAAGQTRTEVGLLSHAGPRPGSPSGSGAEVQREPLESALAADPDLLLLDEPFGALDAPARAGAQRLVGELWQRHGCAVLLATSDVEEAALLADRVLVMDAGAIAYEIAVELDRPRDRTDARFAELRAGLLERLGTEPAA
ncbi:ABC transporter ATP-binding protein [Streptomyces sp. BH-SS-21]|uniref:ABC transporter ATP-binding protein n=1 Tax=Streptomyces liliiviolaceus TaxID=2823109 RepID=A0A941B7R5_9ACTN|nr:ATP-binding cassette domain-containing protein [Streptomyces liliiviolaceus]MBQ0853825.1 ABC transporter ATP-binding protein [Streptomyces liliiviolaceus]